jgi:hypothetical protein
MNYEQIFLAVIAVTAVLIYLVLTNMLEILKQVAQGLGSTAESSPDAAYWAELIYGKIRDKEDLERKARVAENERKDKVKAANLRRGG